MLLSVVQFCFFSFVIANGSGPISGLVSPNQDVGREPDVVGDFPIGVSEDLVIALLGRPDIILPPLRITDYSCILIYKIMRLTLVLYVSDLKERCWMGPGYIPSGGRIVSFRIFLS